MEPDDDINWERVAKDYQIENEVLRNQIKGYVLGRASFKAYSIPSVDFSRVIDWVEKNPVASIVIIYVISTILMDLIEIFRRK